MYALGKNELIALSEFVDLREPFYDLFPDLLENRIRQDYDHGKRTIRGLKHSLNDEPYEIEHELHWYRFGKLHRDHGPAKIYAHGENHFMTFNEDDEYVSRCDDMSQQRIARELLIYEYYFHGFLHRIGGPAYVSAKEEQWYRYGEECKPGDTKRYFDSEIQVVQIPPSIAEKYSDNPIWEEKKTPEEQKKLYDEWRKYVDIHEEDARNGDAWSRRSRAIYVQVSTLDARTRAIMRHNIDDQCKHEQKIHELSMAALYELGRVSRIFVAPNHGHSDGAIKRRMWILKRQSEREAIKDHMRIVDSNYVKDEWNILGYALGRIDNDEKMEEYKRTGVVPDGERDTYENYIQVCKDINKSNKKLQARKRFREEVERRELNRQANGIVNVGRIVGGTNHYESRMQEHIQRVFQLME